MTQSERDEMLIRLDIGINGNGAKGLDGRVDDLEEWQKTRPQECPGIKPDRAIILRQRALEVTVMGLLLATFQFIAKVAGWW